MRKISIFIYVILAGAFLFSVGFAQEIRKNEDGLFTTDKLVDSIKIGSQNNVIIKSASTLKGKIIITTSTDPMVKVSYYKKSNAGSRSHATDYIDLISVNLDRTPDGIRVQLRAPNPAPWNESEASILEIDITVPDSCSIDINAAYFDVTAIGPFTKMKIPSSFGRLSISKVTKELELATSNRRVSIEDINGKISVSTTNSILEAINIRSLNNTAVFQNREGNIRIENFAGQINVRNSYGRIDLTEFQPIGNRNVIRGKSAPVTISITKMIEEQIIVSNHYEDIDITVPADLSSILSLAASDEGRIEVSGLEFQGDLIQESRMSLVAGDGNNTITCNVQGGGNIYIRGIEKDED